MSEEWHPKHFLWRGYSHYIYAKNARLRDSIKQRVLVVEFASAYDILGLDGPGLKVPVQYMLPEFDFYVCGGDCKGLPDIQALKKSYPNTAVIGVAIQPNTGHALTLHNNATAGYQVTLDFLSRNGL
jgi:hypothetical protein